MVGLSPCQALIHEVLLHMDSGQSLSFALRSSMSKLPAEIGVQVSRLLILHQTNAESVYHPQEMAPLRAVLFEILWSGLNGASVVQKLEELLPEAERLAHMDLQNFVSRTPIYSMLIVLLFFFPAFLILTLGPLVFEMLEVLKQ